MERVQRVLLLVAAFGVISVQGFTSPHLLGPRLASFWLNGFEHVGSFPRRQDERIQGNRATPCLYGPIMQEQPMENRPKPGPSQGRIGSLGSKTLRRRAQSKTFIMSELRTDDNLSVSTGGDLLRIARGNWIDDILSTGRSRVLSRISERLGFSAVWAAYVAIVFYIAPPEWGVHEAFEVPGWPHELVGGFLAILLVFRTDQAYQRFWEGRTKWASLASHCKALARLSVSHLGGTQLDEILSHVIAFPIALKQHLRGQRNVKELQTIFSSFGVEGTAATDIASSNNMPLTLLTSLSMVIRKLDIVSRRMPTLESANDQVGGQEQKRAVMDFQTREQMMPMTLELWSKMEDLISELSVVVAECEQIKCTPIPLSYSRHTSRFFTLFSVTLPFALLKGTNLLLVPLIVTGISWILFATEEIGHVIEEPFGQGLDEADEVPLDEQRMRDVFDFFDQDGSGSIDKTEFFLALGRLGINTKVEDIDRLVSEIDNNGNSLVEFDEFVTLLDKAKQEAKLDLAGEKKMTISSSLGTAVIRSIEGFYMVVSMVLGVEKQRQSAEASTKQLEVLPLARYCDQIQKDVLQQVIFASGVDQQQRYVKMAAEVGKATDRGRVQEILS